MIYCPRIYRGICYVFIGVVILFTCCTSASEVNNIYTDLMPSFNVMPEGNTGKNTGKYDQTANIPVVWSVAKEQDLRNVMSQWANEAGWDLVWDSEQTYKLRAAASFNNLSFEQAVSQLFDAIGNMNPKLYVTLYKKNHVILVSSRPEF